MAADGPKPSKVRLVTVRSGQEGQRLDNFLCGHLTGAPRGLIYKIIRTGQVRINGGRAKPSTRVVEGDEVRIPPVSLDRDGPRKVPAGALRVLEAAVVEEDENFICIDKPPGMAVHAGSGVAWGLIDAIRELRGEPGIELVHRLDRETSGLLLLARNKGAMRRLQQQFREGHADKRYLCLLDTPMNEACVLVDQPLKKVERGGQRLVQVGPDGKSAQTEFQRLEALPGCSYAEARLLTGRTHQIRAHAAWLGGPLAGDSIYARRERLEHWRAMGLNRLFLHAHFLAIETATGQMRRFSSPLPEALSAVLERLQSRRGEI